MVTKLLALIGGYGMTLLAFEVINWLTSVRPDTIDGGDLLAGIVLVAWITMVITAISETVRKNN